MAFAISIVCAATAKAAFYDVVFCAGGNGNGNPVLGARPGFFDFGTDCGAPPSYPAGGGNYLRLNENAGGSAGQGDEASMSWYAPPGTAIVAGGGYTREPNAFNAGWRARFWGEDWGGGEHNIMLQGAGIEGTGEFPWITKNTTSIFAAHLWPFGGWDDYKRFVFGLACVRPAGCDRANYNAVDANTITLVADDRQAPQVGFEDGDTVRGEWVRGTKVLAWRESDQGAGLRFSRINVDGGTLGDGTIDYLANGGCRIGYRDGGREFGKSLDPCARGPYLRYRNLETTSIADGAHTLSACLQDYSQYLHGQESCDNRTIRTDNHAPGKPAALEVTSANPARYLSRFGAKWSLPPDHGSPIAKVHYEIRGNGNQVLKQKTVAATNPTTLGGIEGPETPGPYTLHVWLTDTVGHTGAAASVEIPRDTTPPAAPQGLRVTGPTGRWVDELDLRWQDLADAGSPIDTAYYRIVDGAGKVLASGAERAKKIEAIDNLATPPGRRGRVVEVWLSDEEGNVGAAATVALPRDTTPPAAPQHVSVAAPETSRAEEGFDVRWTNLPDDGSPVTAAHYEVLDASGKAAVPKSTVGGTGISSIGELATPRERGGHSLRLWVSDEEGNVGAPVTVPLAYECVRSDVGGGFALSAGLGKKEAPAAIVRQGKGASLAGHLAGASGPAPLCVYSRVATGGPREFLGIALASEGGRYRFALGAGPSRELEVLYRPGQRQLRAAATLRTRVRPTLRLRRSAIHGSCFAYFRGRIPGPGNDGVEIVLQVKHGKGWRVYRRYRTRRGGRYAVGYRFRHTPIASHYVLRAQVRGTAGYAYLPGNSVRRIVHVLPSRPGGHCASREAGRPRPTRAARKGRDSHRPSSSKRRADEG